MFVIAALRADRPYQEFSDGDVRNYSYWCGNCWGGKLSAKKYPTKDLAVLAIKEIPDNARYWWKYPVMDIFREEQEPRL